MFTPSHRSGSARWLRLSALADIGAAGVLLAVGLALPDSRGWLWLTSAILGAAGLVTLTVIRSRPATVPSGFPAGGVVAPSPGEDPADAKKRLLSTGTAGSATVLEARETGEIDGEGRPVYDLRLRIEVAGMPPIEGPARVGIPPERLSQLEAGDTVPVKVDPANPGVMAVDWDSA